MPGLQVRLFGPASVTVDGRPAKLKPITMAVLIRLIVAEGAPVTVDELFRDCWPPGEQVFGDYRTQVQKRILEIRRAVDPGWSSESGEESRVLPTQRGRITAYRLASGHDGADVFQFIELVTEARRGAPEERVNLLERAMSLWSGPPLLDVTDKAWAAPLVRQLSSLRLTAGQELTHAYELAGRPHDALDAAEELAARSPDDPGLAAWVTILRDQVRASHGKRVLREDFADLRTAVVVMTGDLFDQEDANLVIGFCDTFDTDTDRNIVISQESAQGLLLHRLYGDDRDQLDKELRTALARVPRVAVESRSAKPRGKLTRYPVGTVATLHHATRRVFAVAYSRMGNDLMAQSSLLLLNSSLENLWDAVYRHGQLKPVAMPLIGSGLSRTGASYAELLTVIVSTFLASARKRYLGPELRVVIQQPAFDQLKVSAVLKSVRDAFRDAPGHEGDGE
jgi:DNA-binding SARP family transcriptional activator